MEGGVTWTNISWWVRYVTSIVLLFVREFGLVIHDARVVLVVITGLPLTKETCSDQH